MVRNLNSHGKYTRKHTGKDIPTTILLRFTKDIIFDLFKMVMKVNAKHCRKSKND
jgi:hypothetical protein